MDRNLTPELMDDPALDLARHGQALRGLARLNRVSGADRIPWHAIRAWARGSDGPFTVLDVATGSGEAASGVLGEESSPEGDPGRVRTAVKHT